ncbi:MAG: hypothetical protein LBQ65_10630 [Tannerellaceae bacterium]|jgi:microcystin degradation protein MlrC|nr:hypothetical protein [Tannerellaceae bacterium]
MNTIELQTPKAEKAVEELKADLEQAEEEFRKGKVHTQEEVKKAIASW